MRGKTWFIVLSAINFIGFFSPVPLRAGGRETSSIPGGDRLSSVRHGLDDMAERSQTAMMQSSDGRLDPREAAWKSFQGLQFSFKRRTVKTPARQGDKPKRNGDKPPRTGDKPPRNAGTQPSVTGDKPKTRTGDKPKKTRTGDKPHRNGDKPHRGIN